MNKEMEKHYFEQGRNIKDDDLYDTPLDTKFTAVQILYFITDEDEPVRISKASADGHRIYHERVRVQYKDDKGNLYLFSYTHLLGGGCIEYHDSSNTPTKTSKSTLIDTEVGLYISSNDSYLPRVFTFNGFWVDEHSDHLDLAIHEQILIKGTYKLIY